MLHNTLVPAVSLRRHGDSGVIGACNGDCVHSRQLPAAVTARICSASTPDSNQMDVPPETLEQLRAVKSALEDLEQHMQPFLEAAPKEINSQLTPLERVKVHLALAQAVVTLYQLRRRLGAANMENHPLQKELERVAAYEKKVKKAITADELARSRPGTSLNVAAANRFIDAAIPDLTAEQKQQLRNLGKQVQQQPQEPSDAAAAGQSSSKKRRQQQQVQTMDKEQQQKQEQQQEAGAEQQQQQQQQQQGTGDSSDDDKQPKVVAVKRQSGKKLKQSQCKQQQQQKGAKSADAEALEFLQDVLADVEQEES